MKRKIKDTVHILICGFYFEGNTGDDLFASSLSDSLSRYGQVRVASMAVFDTALLDWCDILLVGPGSHITPRGIGGYEHVKYAKERGKFVFFYSLTVEEGQPLLDEHLGRADLITVRDSASKRVVEARGFRAVLASDPIFERKRRKIGFSFRRWVNEPGAIEEQLAAVLDDLAKDYDILSVPYTANDTDTESDSAFHDRVIEKMRSKPPHVSFDAALQEIDLLIGMRLHALISTLNANKKVLAVDYDAKVGRIFADLSLDESVVPYGEVTKIPQLVREKIFALDYLSRREKVNEALVEEIIGDLKNADKPAMSIVMPAYNRAHFLGDAIDSILAQTFKDWELVLIDDGSTDATEELVSSYHDLRIRYYNFGHNGISFSRNIGNLLSRGEIIVVADSDDINLPGRLEVIGKEMEGSGAGLVYSSLYYLHVDGRKEYVESPDFSFEKLRAYNFLAHPTVAYRREVAMQCPYDEGLPVSEDYQMYLAAIEKGFAFRRIREPLVLYRLHGEQETNRKKKETFEYFRNIVEMTHKKGHPPAVTVIIPTYNRPAMLREAIASVIDQTYRSFEIVVVNDGGMDVSGIIKTFGNEAEIIYLQHEGHKGPAAARNTGARAARGVYIAYLDDDDIYYPGHLEITVSFLVNQGASVVYTDANYAFQTWISDRYITTEKRVLYRSDFDRDRLLVSNYIPLLNVVHARDVFVNAGWFDETMHTHEDWDFWIRVSRFHDFVHIKEVTAEVRVRDDLTNTITKRKEFLETLRKIYARYSSLAQSPPLLEERERMEEGLAKEVEMEAARNVDRESGLLHLCRFSRDFTEDKKVLCLAPNEAIFSSIAEKAGWDIAISGPLQRVNEKFDVVICFDAHESVEDPALWVREMKGLLKEGGCLLVSFDNVREYVPLLYKQGVSKKKFSSSAFVEVLKQSFKSSLFRGQQVSLVSDIFPLTGDSSLVKEYTVDKREDGFLFDPPGGRKKARSIIAIMSEAPLDTNSWQSSILVDISGAGLLRRNTYVNGLEAAVRGRDYNIGNLEEMMLNKDVHIATLEEVMRNKDVHISNLEEEKRNKDGHITNLEDVLRHRDSHIGDLGMNSRKLEEALRNADTRISNLEGDLRHRDARIGDLEEALRHRDETLHAMYTSHGWKLLRVYYRIRDRLLPGNSTRRKVVRFAWNLPKTVREKLRAGTDDHSFRPKTPALHLPKQSGDVITPFKDVTVSVIIPTKNAGEEFEHLMAVLRQQEGLKRVEIVVVDSGSSDATVEIARAWGAKVVEIAPEKFSHSYARNLGAENAAGRYLFFTVQDALPPSPRFFHNLFGVLKGNEVVAVSCAEFPREDSDLFYNVLAWNHYRFLGVGQGDRILSMPEQEDHISLRQNGQLSDIACLIAKKIFMKYRYRNDYAEDLDLGLRLIKDGHKLALLSSLRMIHSHDRSAYYFLKRGYVDNIFLSGLFNDFVIPDMQEQTLFKDMLVTYQAVSSLINGDLTVDGASMKTEAVFSLLDKKLRSWDNVDQSSLGQTLAGCPDKQLAAFLERISVLHGENMKTGVYDGILVCAVANFLLIVKDYMVSAYPYIDSKMMEELKACLVKGYALQCGAHLAFCHLKGGLLVRELHDELKEGI